MSELAAAIAAHRAGQSAAAEAGYRRAAAQTPDDPNPWRLLGVLARERGRADIGARLGRLAVALAPGLAEIWRDVAMAARAVGDAKHADQAVVRAAMLAPDDPFALADLGQFHWRSRNWGSARAAYRRAIALAPDDPEGWRGLAVVANEIDAVPAMQTAFARALRLTPWDATLHYNQAICLSEQNDLAGAATAMRRALILDPGAADLVMRWSLALLAAGDPRGWGRFERRWETLEMAALRPHLVGLPWRGEPIAGRTVLVAGEQGLGDVIQGLRYLAPLRERGARIIAGVPAGLADLARRMAVADQVLTPGAPLPSYDFIVPVLSLPDRLGMIGRPNGSAYLQADPDKLARWQARVAGSNFKVGLVWGGNPGLRTDRRRSIALKTLRQLFDLKDVTWHSLQIGPRADEITDLGLHDRLRDHRSDLIDLDEAAAAVMALDLVITVDTALAHLAGALGKPVWIMVYAPAEWRWGHDGPRTPWYDSARLFRQRHPGDWAPVIDEIRQALTATITGGRQA